MFRVANKNMFSASVTFCMNLESLLSWAWNDCFCWVVFVFKYSVLSGITVLEATEIFLYLKSLKEKKKKIPDDNR